MGEAKLRKKLNLPPRGLVASSDPLPSRLVPSPDWHLLMAFLGVWRGGVTLPDQPGHCMLATRLAAEVLRRLGFTVEPARVWLEISRVDAMEIFVGCPVPEHRVGTIWEAQVDPVTGEAGQFEGHLVLRVNAWLLEVAAAQFASPRDRIAPSRGFALKFWPWTHRTDGTVVNILGVLSYSYTPVAPTFDAVPWRAAWDAILESDPVNITPEVLDSLVSETRRVASETTEANYI